MNFELSSPNLSELEAVIATLVADAKCACHIINPHKTRVLMWQAKQADQVIYHLRIGIQKFIAQEQIDRNGEVYWRYYAPEVKQEANKEEEKSTEPNPITKFQQRQEQAKTYGKQPNSTEPTVNSATS